MTATTPGPGAGLAGPPARNTGAAPRRTLGAPLNRTVFRLALHGVLGRRRAILLAVLPVLLLVLAGVVRALDGRDPKQAADFMAQFGVGVIAPLLGLIAGTGVLGPEIDDGSVIHLLTKPVRRSTIVLSKLAAAVLVVLAFGAVPTLVAGLILAGGTAGIAVSFAVTSALALVAYCALFLLLSVVTRQAAIIGLIYALIWESLVGNYVPGAKVLSVQQWALSIGSRLADHGVVTTSVSLAAAIVLIVLATVLATWYAGRRLRVLSLTGDA